MPKKQNAADTANTRQNDNFIYRFIVVLALVVLLALLLHGVQKYYSYAAYMDLIATASGWIAGIAAVLSVAGLAAAAVSGKRMLRGAGGVLLVLAASAACISRYYTDGVTMSYALVIGAGLLYLGAQIYQNEFIFLTGLSGLSAVCYYGISRYSGTSVWNAYTAPLIIGLAVILVAALVMTAAAGRREGRIPIGRWTVTLWQNRSAQVLIFIVCLIWAALLALIFALGATFAWYCVLVAALVIFALTVWFTIKLM